MQAHAALRKPYLLFLGDDTSAPYAKTAYGIRDWAPEACLAQWRLTDSGADLGLPDLTPEAAVSKGAASLVIGVAPPGGCIPAHWEACLLRAARAGLDIVSGLHTALAGIPGLADAAGNRGVALVDVRHPGRGFAVATGLRRQGKRLLTVGTDCALGKKYAALALARGLRARGIAADFRATGQTGIMISGGGVAIDAVVGDFMAGAAEWLSPDADPDHWDVIEGQGSLFHPAYAGVTTSLVHGSQPDALVLCHDPARTHISDCPHIAIPPLPIAARHYLDVAALTNPGVRLAGVSLNTARLDSVARARLLAETEAAMEVPCFDPLQSSLDAVLDRVLSCQDAYSGQLQTG